MEIQIDKNKKIVQIQEEFQKRFPNLKIEFFKKVESESDKYHVKNKLSTNLTLGEISSEKLNNTIEITGLTKVGDLEQEFANKFGLAVQVFRKSGNVWLLTTTTNNWTLAEQNQRAMEKPVSNSTQPRDPMDMNELE